MKKGFFSIVRMFSVMHVFSQEPTEYDLDRRRNRRLFRREDGPCWMHQIRDKRDPRKLPEIGWVQSFTRSRSRGARSPCAMTIRLKPDSSPPSPFSWDIHPPSPPLPAALPSPPTSWLSAKDMKLYGSRPLSSTPDIGVVKCKDCAKPILRSFISEHSSQSASLDLYIYWTPI